MVSQVGSEQTVGGGKGAVYFNLFCVCEGTEQTGPRKKKQRNHAIL
jgi:hypothetical protein